MVQATKPAKFLKQQSKRNNAHLFLSLTYRTKYSYDTIFTIDGDSKTATGGDAGAIPVWLEGTHYALFEDVAGGADVFGTASPGQQGYAVLSGMQIAKVSSATVPEPSTAILALLGLGCLVFCRRRKVK